MSASEHSLPHSKRGKISLKFLMVLFLPLVLAAAITIFVSSLFSLSMIDVGLDLMKQPTQPPLICWGEGVEARVTPELIDERFSPRRQCFQIDSYGEKIGAAKANTITLIGCTVLDQFRLLPAENWKRLSPTALQTSGTRCASLIYSGITPVPYLQFQMNNASGNVYLTKGNEARKRIILYSDVPEGLKVELPSNENQARYRYHAFVPRRALGNLCVSLPGIDPQDVRRVYLGALKPVVISPQGDFDPCTWSTRISSTIPIDGETPIPLPNYTLLEQGGAVGNAVVFAAVWLLLLAALWGAAICWRMTLWLILTAPVPRRLAPFHSRQFLFYFLPLLLVWLFFWACFYPGGMSPDSVDQWDQIHTMVIYDAHPALHTLTIKLLSLAWDSPAVVSLTQVLLMAACMAYGFTLLRRAGVGRFWVVLALLCVMLSFRNGNLVVTVWKDVLFTIVVAALVLLLCHILLDSARRPRLLYWIALGLLLGINPLYRHNGIAILAGMIVLLPIFFWRWRFQAALALCIACAFVGGVRKVVYPYFKVHPLTNVGTWYYSTRITALIYQDVPLSNKEYDFLNHVRTLETRWPYNPIMNNEVVYGPLYSNGFALQNEDVYATLDQSFALRYPLIYFRQFARATAYIWMPMQPGADRISTGSYGISGNNYNLEMKPLCPTLGKWLRGLQGLTIEKHLIWLFWRPAIHLYLTLLAMLILLVRTRDPRLLIVFAPGMMNAVTLLLAGMSQDHRYLFPTTLLTSFSLCLALIPKAAPVASGGVPEEDGGGTEAQT